MRGNLAKKTTNVLLVACMLALSIGLFACGSVSGTQSGSESAPNSQTSSTCNHQVVVDERVEPTCEQSGLTSGAHCGLCGEVFTQQEEIPATGHNFSNEYSFNKDAHWFECDCGKKNEESAHSYEWETVVNPTENSDGLKKGTCVCGYEKTESIPAVDHEHSYEATVTEPTCTEDGFTTYECACGDSYVSDVVESSGHKFNSEYLFDAEKHWFECNCGEKNEIAPHDYEWQTIKEPTESEEGLKKGKCVCGHEKEQTVPVLSHEHNYSKTITAPTCASIGYTTYECACGDNYITDIIDPLGHREFDEVELSPHSCDWNNVVTAGTYLQTCIDCGATRILREVRHVFEETIYAPTCTDFGFTALRCVECGYVDGEEHDIVDALGHDWKFGYDVVQEGKTICEDGGSYVNVCAVCSLVSEPMRTDPIGHNVATWNLTIPATMTGVGQIRGACSQCPNVVMVALPKLSAEYYAVSVAVLKPECENREVAERYSIWVSVKGELSKEEVEGATGFYFDIITKSTKHMLNGLYMGNKVDVEVLVANGGRELFGAEATCTSEGQGWFICDNCGQDVGIVTNKLPHEFNESDVVAYEGQEPTCTESGFGTAKCYTCDETIEVVIPATGHLAESLSYNLMEIDGEVYIETYCLACGMNELFLLEDEPVIVEATCIAEGSITYRYEATDGGIYTYVETIAKKDHLCGEVRIGASCLASVLVANGGQEFPLEEATCTRNGRGFFVCEYCENAIYVITLAHGIHNFDTENESYVAPTCTTPGKGTCTSCGLPNDEVAPALGHEYAIKIKETPSLWSEGAVIVTCNRTDSEGYNCCDFEAIYTILSIDDAMVYGDYYELEVVVDPTCSTSGINRYRGEVLITDLIDGEYVSTVLDYSFEVVIPALGHDLYGEKIYSWSETVIEKIPVVDSSGEFILDESGIEITKEVEVSYDYEGYLCDDCRSMIVTDAIAHIYGRTVRNENGYAVVDEEYISHVVNELLIIYCEYEENVLDENGNGITKRYAYHLMICEDLDCEIETFGYGILVLSKTEIV